MRKVKLIVHEKYAGKQNPSDVFAAVFLSDTAALTPGESPGIMKSTDKSQDSLCSGKGVLDGTSECYLVLFGVCITTNMIKTRM